MSRKDEVRGTFGSMQLPATRPADIDTVLAGGAAESFVTQPVAGGGRAPKYGPAPVSERATDRAVRGAFAGLGAGGSVGPSYDARSAAVNVGTAALSGGVSGFMAGGPGGAAAGFLLGGLTSGLNAWLQVDAENKRRSEMEALIREQEAKEDAREKRDRADELSALKYNRRQAELEQAWGVAQANRARVSELLDKNQTLRDRWVKTGSIQ